jgi:hypothetical protein
MARHLLSAGEGPTADSSTMTRDCEGKRERGQGARELWGLPGSLSTTTPGCFPREQSPLTLEKQEG